MKKTKLNVSVALSYLKAGYHLKCIIDRKEEFVYWKEGFVHIVSEQKGLQLDSYLFLDLYKDSFFEILEDSEEETVDIKKDEEYYSWRQ